MSNLCCLQTVVKALLLESAGDCAWKLAGDDSSELAADSDRKLVHGTISLACSRQSLVELGSDVVETEFYS